jgi:alpha-N-arabinofuranosidase
VEANKYKKIGGTILTSPKLQNHNTFENPDKIKPQIFSGASLKGDVIKLKIPPFSVIVLELK